VKGVLLLQLAALVMGTATAQRAKPGFDPETKDGLLIQHIEQESDATEKLHYLEQFAAQYPSHPAIAWVYDQLQPEYFRLKDYDQAMRIGAQRVAIEPDNLEAATLALRSADAQRHAHPAPPLDQIIKWSVTVYHLGSLQASRGGADAGTAKQAAEYAESCLYSTAAETEDPKIRLGVLQKLDQEMSSSRYSSHLPILFFRTYRQLGDDDNSVEMADKGLKLDPDNIEMLMFLTEIHFRKENAHERQLVAAYSTRLVDVLSRKERPQSEAEMADPDWEKRKAEMLGMASFMGGMSYDFLSNFAKADVMFRAALPYVAQSNGKDSEARLAALLYHLGMANYRLAESGGERSRPVDALKFMRRCAAIRSPFQEQAIKNVEGIKAEYNLP
jgi:tetratricopeptide (TPR) repeat protein